MIYIHSLVDVIMIIHTRQRVSVMDLFVVFIIQLRVVLYLFYLLSDGYDRWVLSFNDDKPFVFFLSEFIGVNASRILVWIVVLVWGTKFS